MTLKTCPECCFPYDGDACDNPACEANPNHRPPVKQVSKDLREYKWRLAATKPGAVCAFERPAGFVLARVDEQRFGAEGWPEVARLCTLDSLREYHDTPSDDDPCPVALISRPELQRAARRVVKAKEAPQRPIDKEDLRQLIISHKES